MRRASSSRRIIAVVVPPVDELDLVGPLQVFNSINRLAGRTIYTSAGISAGIDLALAWVEEDCGAGLAHEAARELVLFLRRPGGQPQMSVSLASQASEMMSIRELQIWIAEHLATKLSVEELA